MKILFLLLPFIFSSSVAYILNVKLNSSQKDRILLSIFEGFTVSLIGLLIFYPRFFVIWIIIPLVLVALGLLLVRLWSDELFNSNEDLKIETIKNTLILFIFGYIPILVLLTIFRFMHWYIQIPLSIVLSGIFIFSIYKLQQYTNNIVYSLIEKFKLAEWTKYLYFWGIAFVIVMLGFMFRIPMDPVSESLHLSNRVGFGDAIGLPYNTQNNFEQEIILQIEENIDVTDYTYDDDYFYIIESRKRIIIYSLDTFELVDEIESSLTLTDFISYEDEIYVRSTQELYRLDDMNLELALFTGPINGYFYNNDILHYYTINNDVTHYEIYQVIDETATMTDTIEIESLVRSELVRINGHLFIKSLSELTQYGHPERSFEIHEGESYYDEDERTMYFGNSSYEDYLTTYTKVTLEDTETYTLTGTFVSIPRKINDVIYYTNQAGTFKSEGEHILIMSDEYKINTTFTHTGIDKFTKWNDYTTTILEYIETEDGLEFIQEDKSDAKTITTFYRLIDRNVDVELPFYSYFGLNAIYLILFTMFIPITNYKSNITVLGGKQKLNIQKGAE